MPSVKISCPLYINRGGNESLQKIESSEKTWHISQHFAFSHYLAKKIVQVSPHNTQKTILNILSPLLYNVLEMPEINIAINGLGRIGRVLIREFFHHKEHTNLKLVAVNALTKPEMVSHLIKYDSIHGRSSLDVTAQDHMLRINGTEISYYRERDPEKIPWPKNDVHIVIDATGAFRTQKDLLRHKRGSVSKVILCSPGKDVDTTIVMGINHQTYDPAKHHIISNASCTTNCLAPIAKVIDDTFKILSGLMTTIHSYTGDQRLLDKEHGDRRRARGAALSMIPTTTGAAQSIGEVIPKLKGKLDGLAVRVPTPNVSLTDLTAVVERTTTAQEVNEVLQKASQTSLKNILRYEREELVSIDYIGMRESSCVDASLTRVIDGKTMKIISWYDNEVGFSNRVLDLSSHVGQFLSC